MAKLAQTGYRIEDSALAQTIKARKQTGNKYPRHFFYEGIRHFIIGPLMGNENHAWLIKQDDEAHKTDKPVTKQLTEDEILAAIEKHDACSRTTDRISARHAIPPRPRQAL